MNWTDIETRKRRRGQYLSGAACASLATLSVGKNSVNCNKAREFGTGDCYADYD